MFEKISGISIKGRCFTEEKALDFFPTPSKDRLAIIYGQNGSGKTTCAKGFCLCANPQTRPEELTAQLRDAESSSGKLPTPEDGWRNIHIFDEDYIIKNLKIDTNGLGSIVLLGEQVDVDKQLNELRQKEEEYNGKLIPVKARQEKLSDPSCEESPEYIKHKIFEKLKGGGAWAEIDRDIKGNRANSRVDDALFNEFLNMQISEKLEFLQSEFSKNRLLYDRTAESEQLYPNAIACEPIVAGIDLSIINALEKVIERPELSERDKKIFEILTTPSNRNAENITEFFHSDASICPYCFQPVSSEYKTNLLKTISTIFSKEADSLKSEINRIKPHEITRDFSTYASLDADLFTQIQSAVRKCNGIAQKYNNLLEQKINNVFSPITVGSLDFERCLKELNEIIGKLEIKRQAFMAAVNERSSLKSRLILLNKKVYRKITDDLFISYKRSSDSLSDTQRQLSEITDSIENIENKITELRQKKENIFIAIDKINHDLQYVFFSKNRIVLEPQGVYYTLKINGEQVKPCDVSCGERNAIALCYFFTESFRAKNLADAYQEESLFVIDDPVSSFDIGNRVGINSYLKYKIQHVIDGNVNSKVLVFSHDIVTAWDLEKAFREICNSRGNVHYCIKELDDGSLIDFRSDKRNEYSSLMGKTYDFALNKSGDSHTIGNVVRRMLETFSTFIYRKSIEELSYAPDIGRLFGNKSCFFNNLMYRLVLHGESHSRDAVRSSSDEMLCFCYATDDEKQKMAQYIISMLYILQGEHVLIHLEEKGPDVSANIERWLQNIPINTTAESNDR